MTYNKTTKPFIKPQPHKKATSTKKNNRHKTIKTNPTTKETTKNETKANTNEQKNNNKTTPTKKTHHPYNTTPMKARQWKTHYS